MMSHIGAPVIRFDSRQPTNSPGIAAGVKYGRMVRASEIRICIAPLAKSKAAIVTVRTV